jgi:hypothetical protein
MCLHIDASITGLRMSHSGIQICAAPTGDRMYWLHQILKPAGLYASITGLRTRQQHEHVKPPEDQFLQPSGYSSIPHYMCSHIDSSIMGLRMSHSYNQTPIEFSEVYHTKHSVWILQSWYCTYVRCSAITHTQPLGVWIRYQKPHRVFRSLSH